MIIDLAQNTLDGIASGAAYALLALGFSLMFGVVRRINLAYGASIMLGLYAGAYLSLDWHAGWLAAAAAAVLGSVAAGLYVERLCFHRIGGDAALASMVASFAIWMQLEELATLLLPLHSYPFPALIQSRAC